MVLKLEKFAGKEDFKLFEMLVFDKTIMKMNLGRVFTYDEAQEFYQMLLSCNKEGKELGFYKVYLAATNEFIGMGSINENEEYHALEIEYMLLPEYWHKGYGTNLVTLLISKIETFFNVSKIIAITDPDNIYSKKYWRNIILYPRRYIKIWMEKQQNCL